MTGLFPQSTLDEIEAHLRERGSDYVMQNLITMVLRIFVAEPDAGSVEMLLTVAAEYERAVREQREPRTNIGYTWSDNQCLLLRAMVLAGQFIARSRS